MIFILPIQEKSLRSHLDKFCLSVVSRGGKFRAKALWGSAGIWIAKYLIEVEAQEKEVKFQVRGESCP